MANVRATVNNMNGTKERSHGLQLDWHLNAQAGREISLRQSSSNCPCAEEIEWVQTSKQQFAFILQVDDMLYGTQCTGYRYINVAYYTYY